MSSLLSGAFPSQPIPHLFTLPGDKKHAYIVWRLMSQFAGIAEKDFREMEAKGWRKIDPKADEPVLRILESQFSEILEVAARGTADFVQWTQEKDFDFARAYPVMITAQVEVEGDKYVTEEAVPGSHAFVVDDGKFYAYTIDQLGDDGLAAWKYIRQWQSPVSLHDIRSQKINIKQTNQQLQAMWKARAKGLQTIKDLAVLYWKHHQQEQKKSRAIPPIPMLFENSNQVDIPNTLAIRGILSAYSNAHSGATQWSHTDAVPSYTFQQENESAIVEWRPLQANIADLTQLLWNQVNQLSDLDGDVLLACIAQWLANHDDSGASWITAEHILNYRGIQPRKFLDAQGAERPSTHRFEDLQAIEASIDHIRNTHVSTQQWVAEERAPGQRGRPKKKLLLLQSYVLTISDFLEEQSIFEEGEVESIQIAWRFRPGECIESFAQGTNLQVALLFQQALAYDFYRELWEKRLARYFMLRVQSVAGEATACQVADLFAESSLQLDKRNPDRMKQRFEQALNRLVADKIISSWRYQENIDDLPSKKWGEIWLSYHVLVRASPVMESLERPQTKNGLSTRGRKRRISKP